MRILLLLTLISSSIFSTQLFSRAIVEEGAHIYDPDRQYLKLFSNNPELTIDSLSSQGYEVYGPKGLIKWITGQNIVHLDLNKINKRADDYPSNEANTQKLKKLAETYPEILHLFSIGKSIKGQDIWVMKISDNPTIDEIEPEFKYIANMHGNEVTGREMVIRLIEDMAKGYRARNAKMRELIDNTEIFIIPTMNPDGFTYKRRGNADYTDLNRDFPDFINDPNNSFVGRAPETKAIMAFQASRFFALSANYHDGATVINYPWDSTYERFPLDNLVSSLSLEYSSKIPSMYNSSEFTNGITNGADWYVVHGGMQDWSYYWYGDMQITVEVSLNKWPRYSEIAKFYSQHKNSMLTYMERIHQGAGFYFPEKNYSGTVSIEKADSHLSLGSYPFSQSQFYKVLEEGTYNFHVETKNGESFNFEVQVDSALQKENGNYKILI